jgi:hypothetical protein
MHPAGFEPAIPGSQRPQTDALGRKATEWACTLLLYVLIYCISEIGPRLWCQTIMKNRIIIIIITIIIIIIIIITSLASI